MNNGETKDNNLVTALGNLARSKNRPMTARLKEVMPEIESALQSGARRKDIHQVLISNGFDGLSFEVFEVLVYRIRKINRTVETPRHRVHFPSVVSPATPEKSNPQGSNPLSSLSRKPLQGEFSPIPSTKIEIED